MLTYWEPSFQAISAVNLECEKGTCLYDSSDLQGLILCLCRIGSGRIRDGPSRKWHVHSKMWRRNQLKSKKDFGLSYRSAHNGVQRPARKIGSPCKHSCKLNCDCFHLNLFWSVHVLGLWKFQTTAKLYCSKCIYSEDIGNMTGARIRKKKRTSMQKSSSSTL
jgi:hypothetical protein